MRFIFVDKDNVPGWELKPPQLGVQSGPLGQWYHLYFYGKPVARLSDSGELEINSHNMEKID